MERRNARTAGRSALAQNCAMVEGMLTARRSQGDGNGIDDIAKHGFRGFRFLLQGGMARTGYHAVRKNGNGQLLGVVRQAIVAAVEKSTGLRGALEHQCAARADAESELLGLARAIDDVECVVVEAGVHLYVCD